MSKKDLSPIGSAQPGTERVPMTLDKQRRLVARRAQLLSELEGLPAQRKEARDGTPGDNFERAVSISRLEDEEGRWRRELAGIDSQLAAAQIIPKEGCGRGRVALGSRVKVQFLTGKRVGKDATYLITGNGNGNPSEGELQATSPLAAALLEHRARPGQKVKFEGGDKQVHQVLVKEVH